MRRIIEIQLEHWARSKMRKPLILRGARQVGKTYAVRQMAKLFKNIVEINFELFPDAKLIFEGELDPVIMLRKLSLLTKTPIIPGETLLFLDEVQEMPRAIIALRYFYELMPEQHVIAAGSLLDFALEDVGVPVGRVQFLHLYPMTFFEFLAAQGNSHLATVLLHQDPSQPIAQPIHNKALNILGEYLALGGMPEVVEHWIKTGNIEQCQSIAHQITQAYQQDFLKYAKKTQLKYVDLLFQQLPIHQGKPFKYSHLKTDYRKRELEPCFELLVKAKICNKVYASDGQSLPLFSGAKLDVFKVLGLDIGLSQAILGEGIESWFLEPATAMSNKGSIVEAFVGQELLAYQPASEDVRLFYWQRHAKNSNAEIDYLWVQNKKIVPIEVKSRYGSSLQSMRLFMESHKDTPYGIRFSAHDFNQHDRIHSYPLYAVMNIIEDKNILNEFIGC